jgi:hypothetical protein
MPRRSPSPSSVGVLEGPRIDLVDDHLDRLRQLDRAAGDEAIGGRELVDNVLAAPAGRS